MTSCFKFFLIHPYLLCKNGCIGPKTVPIHFIRRSLSSITPYGHFENAKDKNKESFLLAIKYFYERENARSGQVEFIYRAMKYMDEFGVSNQREVYIKLLDLFPKGKLIPENTIQAGFKHYPRQQDCAVELLDKMENNGVVPNRELYNLVMNIFGKYGHPTRKVKRMLYWMPRFKNVSPWLLPEVLPNESIELAKIAIQRICSVDAESVISEYDTSNLDDDMEKTWIISGQSLKQKKLIDGLSKEESIFIEGPFRIWIRNNSIAYFVLRANPKIYEEYYDDGDDVSCLKYPFYSTADKLKPLTVTRTVHEQDDGTYLAVCATGTSNNNSLVSWIKFLEKENPNLSDIPILLTLKSLTSDSQLISQSKDNCKKPDPDIEEVLKLQERDSKFINRT